MPALATAYPPVTDRHLWLYYLYSARHPLVQHGRIFVLTNHLVKQRARAGYVGQFRGPDEGYFNALLAKTEPLFVHIYQRPAAGPAVRTKTRMAAMLGQTLVCAYPDKW